MPSVGVQAMTVAATIAGSPTYILREMERLATERAKASGRPGPRSRSQRSIVPGLLSVEWQARGYHKYFGCEEGRWSECARNSALFLLGGKDEVEVWP